MNQEQQTGAQAYFQELERGIAALPKEEQENIYRPCAVECVKNTVLPEMRRQFAECGGSLDRQYEAYGDTEYFFARTVTPGRVYELGYPRCLCPLAAEGFAKAASHCECSRQSILYVLRELLPGRDIRVETLETVLGGGEKCRFRATVE